MYGPTRLSLLLYIVWNTMMNSDALLPVSSASAAPTKMSSTLSSTGSSDTFRSEDASPLQTVERSSHGKPTPAASSIAERFKARPYKAPWWARDSHFSTIYGSGEIQKRFGNQGPQVAYRRERWNTPDGDFIDVDFLDTPGVGLARSAMITDSDAESDFGDDDPSDSAPFAVLTHGLESTSTAPLTARMALAFQRKGFRVAVMCFRSCSGEDNRTLRAYHLGFTDDIELVCKTLRKRYPRSSLFLSGFSLGGNVISKFLGELGEQAKELGIMGAAVTCVPFHAVSCQPRIDSGFGKMVYARNFLKTLIPKVMRKAQTDPRVAELVDLEKLQKITTIGEFDDMVIAPFFGFDDFQDYYRKNQAGQFLKGVRVPMLVVQAENDPFMDPSMSPTLQDLEGAPVRLSYHEHGGHCAFIVGDREENQRGWLATELARFGEHASKNRESLD